MSHKNHIEGVIRLSTPMHCAMPGDKIKDASPTMQISIVTGSGKETMPFFPGNDLRGRLRRKAAAIVMPALVSEGGKLPLDLYAGLTCGASDASPENELSIEEALRYSKNVYMGIFGGGKRLLRSRFSVQDLIPITQSTIHNGLVPSKYEMLEEGWAPIDHAWKLIDHLNMTRVDDIMHVVRPDEIEANVANSHAAVAEYQAFHLGTSATRKEEKKAKVSDDVKTKKTDVANMMKIQVIPAGTPMYFRMDFNDQVTDAQVGLMLQSLEALVNEQALGGWCRIGLGKYNITEMNLVRNGERMPVFTEENKEEIGYQLNPMLAKIHAEPAAMEVAALTVADMLSYFKHSKGE